MKRMSRRGFLSALRTQPSNEVRAKTALAIAPQVAQRLQTEPATTEPSAMRPRTFLDEFYADRARTHDSALAYEPPTFVWDEALIELAKRKGDV